MPSKRCTKCREVKILSAFNNQKIGKFGKQSVCRSCWKIHYGYHTWSDKTKARCWARSAAHQRTNPKATLLRAFKLAVARRRGNYTKDDIYALWQKQGGKCALSRIAMTFRNGTGRAEPTSVTIDRIDNSRGYDKDNIRLLCFAINSFRGAMTDEALLIMAATLVKSMKRASIS